MSSFNVRKTLIGVHEMHGQILLQLFYWPMTPLANPMITHTPPAICR